MLVAAEVKLAGGVRALARRWKVSPAHVSDMQRGKRGPGPAILKHLGYAVSRSTVTRYTKLP